MNIVFAIKNLHVDRLGVMLLSSILKKAGHSVIAIEANRKSISWHFKKKCFDIIAYSVPTIESRYYMDLNEFVKSRYDVFSVFGGAHPTFAPEIINDDYIDCVCRGEAEGAFLELVNALEKKRDITKIKNLWVKKDNVIYGNDVRPLLENLDCLPFPDRELFANSESYASGKLHVLTGRGCPYECSYCCHAALLKIYGHSAKRILRRSVDNVLREILEIRNKTKINFVMFEDDLFLTSDAWLNEFCDKYKTQISLPFFCYVRADLINKRVVDQLKEAGCVTVSLGLEIENEELRKTILNREMSNKAIMDACKMIKEAGIRLEIMNIVGIPETAVQDDFKTLKFNIECRPDYAAVKLLAPYPGTKIHEQALRKGQISAQNLDYSNWRTLNHYKDKRDKRAVENFRLLFPVCVEWPWLFLLVKKIISLPLGLFFKIVYLVWEGHAAYFRLYPTGLKGAWRGFMKYGISFKNLQRS
jgi:radical SAM superfamily enzyme YgiQ (UPF0313 family)